MQTTVDPVIGYPGTGLVNEDSVLSAVSWQAIAAGTVVASAASLLLLTLGAGAGFGALSTWPHPGASATKAITMTAIGLIVVQWLSAGIGGYVTGRLRTKWTSLHTHEVFFRDTAHGLITWAAATLLVAIAVASTGGSTARETARAASTVATAATVDPYDVDVLLRPVDAAAQTSSETASNDIRSQVTRILAAGLLKGDIPTADRTYLTQSVVAQARVSQDDASARVDSEISKIKADHDRAIQAADSARKAAEAASIYTAFAMLLGAFIACIAAVLGGHRRDVHA
jgi:hypothetical protein